MWQTMKAQMRFTMRVLASVDEEPEPPMEEAHPAKSSQE